MISASFFNISAMFQNIEIKSLESNKITRKICLCKNFHFVCKATDLGIIGFQEFLFKIHSRRAKKTQLERA